MDADLEDSSREAGSNARAALKRASAMGAALNLGSQFGKFAGQLLYQVALSRLLAPRDFGLVAMIGPVLAFIQLFADLGLSQATVQRPRITSGQLSLLFWTNVAASALLGLITITCAPLLGSFYGEPRVVAITAASGGIFLLSGLSGQHLALLNRRMEFGKLVMIDLGAFLLSALAGLLSAEAGLRYWAIVIAQGVNSLSTCVLAWSVSHWRPGRPDAGGDWRGLVGFGANLTGFNVANYFARNLDNVLIGRFNGGYALGLYDRAYKLMLMPLSQITTPLARVAQPLLARTLGQPAMYRKAYLYTLQLVLILTYPGVLFAVVTHEQLIRVVLGDKWAGVAPIFAILGVGALFAPIGNSTGWLFVSQNRTRELLRVGAISSVLFVSAFIVGLRWGPVGVASCYIGVGIVIQGPMVLWAATRRGPVSSRDVLGALAAHLPSIIVCCSLEVALQTLMAPRLRSLLALLGMAYVAYLGTMLAVPRGRAVLAAVWRHARFALLGAGTAQGAT